LDKKHAANFELTTLQDRKVRRGHSVAAVVKKE